uniref:Membrane integral NOTCH2 associated receptor 2 n=1 Tax=Scleropages formosus TaxID=113540 RepID=A0A8C9TFB0_SCLFO
MDLSALPNNNRPEKLLQLDVNSLPASHGMFEVGSAMGAALSGGKQWQNRVYYQVNYHRAAGKAGVSPPPPAFRTVKTNPLYTDMKSAHSWETKKSKPSWTIQEYDRHSLRSGLADYLKEDPRDLNFWLEDLYTPGFDSLLKKKEAEQRRNKLCKIVSYVILLTVALIVIIVVPIVATNNKN